MRRKLIIDGNAVYEIDDECARRKEASVQRSSWELEDRVKEKRGEDMEKDRSPSTVSISRHLCQERDGRVL